MAYDRWRGFGQGRGGGRRKMFFLESCLLVLLLWGYSLMDGLREFGFQTEKGKKLPR